MAGEEAWSRASCLLRVAGSAVASIAAAAFTLTPGGEVSLPFLAVVSSALPLRGEDRLRLLACTVWWLLWWWAGYVPSMGAGVAVKLGVPLWAVLFTSTGLLLASLVRGLSCALVVRPTCPPVALHFGFSCLASLAAGLAPGASLASPAAGVGLRVAAAVLEASGGVYSTLLLARLGWCA